MIKAFVPMRSGSKGIPSKNIKEFCGKPLFYWVIKELIKTPKIDNIVVSTDDIGIVSQVNSYFNHNNRIRLHKRSKESANDINHWEMAISEYLETYRVFLKDDDVLVMAQVTSPFTQALDFTCGLDTYDLSNSHCSVVTCARAHRFFWNKHGYSLNYDHNHRPRRQDFEGTLVENGAFCINSIGNLRRYKNRLSPNVAIYEMAPHTIVEIDSEDDWYYAEYLFKKYVLNNKGQK